MPAAPPVEAPPATSPIAPVSPAPPVGSAATPPPVAPSAAPAAELPRAPITPGDATPPAPVTEAPPERRPEHRLVWRYPRFRPWQFVAVGVQTAGNLYIEFGDLPSRAENWRNPLPFEKQVRDAFRAQTKAGINRAAVVSDVLWWTTQYYTVVVESLLVPLAFDDLNTDVAFQMTMINWQALGLTGIVTRIAHHTGGRARPSTYGCSDEPDAEFPCRSAGPGFFAGHVSMTTAGAALSCAHNAALPIYGHGPGGAVACGVLSAGALSVGVLRMVADRHWISDVIVGHAVGAAIGYGLPWLLHYQEPITPELAWLGARRVAWLPWVSDTQATLSLIGQF